MALHTHNLGRPQGLPLEAVLASIPSYPRPVIERLVARLIDTLDEQDAPTEEMEVAWPETSLWRLNAPILNEDDEDDDPAGGNVEDEGEPCPSGDDGGTFSCLTACDRKEVARYKRLARRRRK